MAARGLGARIEQIVLELAAKRGKRITLEEFGILVGRAENGRGRPYSATAVSEWIQGRNEPRIATIEAIAKISGRRREWIAFGDELRRKARSK